LKPFDFSKSESCILFRWRDYLSNVLPPPADQLYWSNNPWPRRPLINMIVPDRTPRERAMRNLGSWTPISIAVHMCSFRKHGYVTRCGEREGGVSDSTNFNYILKIFSILYILFKSLYLCTPQEM
jgi:hypothetical protein